MAFPFFEGKAKKMKLAIAALETRVESKRAESDVSQGRLRDALAEAARMPLAGSLVWPPRRKEDGDV